MTPHDFAQRGFDGGDVKRSAQANDVRHVVERVVGFELIEEPESLLSEGKRQRVFARNALQGQCGEAMLLALHSFESFHSLRSASAMPVHSTVSGAGAHAPAATQSA